MSYQFKKKVYIDLFFFLFITLCCSFRNIFFVLIYWLIFSLGEVKAPREKD